MAPTSNRKKTAKKGAKKSTPVVIEKGSKDKNATVAKTTKPTPVVKKVETKKPATEKVTPAVKAPVKQKEVPEIAKRTTTSKRRREVVHDAKKVESPAKKAKSENMITKAINSALDSFMTVCQNLSAFAGNLFSGSTTATTRH
ncbi:hypothetical protein BBOV_I002895 [Babesia bovis T2Bo]|uniref:hypothetical protein n=1 Tax=Babesia bovis T2Bo TaxID=484906 RepID=UPI001C345ABA|nr:hypothetical protein BBOV_I002895 [Babesia bovis T2Bo]KAG6440196.1 hypothetical protein BBOV_I002895 [Babesia bovis T2Bo]